MRIGIDTWPCCLRLLTGRGLQPLDRYIARSHAHMYKWWYHFTFSNSPYHCCCMACAGGKGVRGFRPPQCCQWFSSGKVVLHASSKYEHWYRDTAFAYKESTRIAQNSRDQKIDHYSQSNFPISTTYNLYHFMDKGSILRYSVNYSRHTISNLR